MRMLADGAPNEERRPLELPTSIGVLVRPRAKQLSARRRKVENGGWLETLRGPGIKGREPLRVRHVTRRNLSKQH